MSPKRETRRLCIGRDKLCSEVLQSAIRQGAVLLFGGRQCGKTSALMKIADEFRIEQEELLIKLPVFVNLMLLPYDAGPGDVFALMSQTAAEVCRRKVPGFSVPPVSSSRGTSLDTFFRDVQRIIAGAPRYEIRLIFLLDEAKRILTHRFPRGFQDNLFAILFSESPISGSVSMVFAGAQDLYDMCEDGTSPIASRAAFHFLNNLDAQALEGIVGHFHQHLGVSDRQEISLIVNRLTGGQASFSRAIASDPDLMASLKSDADLVIESLRQRYLGLLRVWAESLSEEARLVYNSLLLQTHDMSLPETSVLLQKRGKDPLRADRAIEELCFTGIAKLRDGNLSVANTVYAHFARTQVTEQPHSELERSVWALIENTEISLRRLIRKLYDEKWGAAADVMIEKALGPDAWKKIRENSKKAERSYKYSRAAASDILEFTYLGQLHILIIWNKAWDLFKSMFQDKRELGDMIAAIAPVRNEEAHFRRAPARELERCKLRCEDLVALIEQHHPSIFS